MRVVIRTAVVEDIEALAELHVSAWNAARPAGFESLPIADRLDRWRSRYEERQERHAVYVAEVGGTIAGFVRVLPGPDGDLDGAVFGKLDELFVDEKHWGSGLAQQLMDEGLSFLRRSGLSSAALWVIEEHPRARAFYAKHGWLPDGARKVAFSAGNRDVMEIRYTKRL